MKAALPNSAKIYYSREMRIRTLGRSGLLLSALGLGTRTWGLDTEYGECDEMLRAFITAGGSYLQIEDDPAYPEPLETLGALLAQGVPREKFSIGVVSGRFTADSVGPSRTQLLDSLNRVLQTLGTDHIDLWTIRGPRRTVPLIETISAIQEAYQQGKVRYLGLSGFSWWDAGKIQASLASRGATLSAWGAPVSLLSAKAPAEESFSLSQEGIGIVAGAPLAHGVLTAKYRHSTPADARAASPRFRPEIAPYLNAGYTGIIDGLVRAADGLDKSPAQVALAWSLDAPGVATSVVGPRSLRQLEHLLEVADWKLPEAIRSVLTEIAGA